MAKIVYNGCFGGFSLSRDACERYAEITGKTVRQYDQFVRNDPALVQVVEELGENANGGCASLCIEEVPAGTLYRIDDYDGYETVILASNQTWLVA